MKGDRIRIKNPDSIRNSLQKENNPDSRIKLLFLNLMTDSPLEFEKICKFWGIAVSTGYEWIRNWNEKGYESVIEKVNKGGRPPRLSAQDLQQLDKYLDKKKSWQLKELKTLIKIRHGVDLSEGQIARILKQKLKKDSSRNFRGIHIDSWKKYLDLLDNTGNAVLLIDREEKITYWNQNAEMQFGWKSEESTGKNIHTLMTFSDSHEEKNNIMQEVLSEKDSKDILEIKGVILHRDGSRIDVSLTLSSLKDTNLNTTGALGIIRKILENNRTNDLKKSNEELEECVQQRALEINKVNKLSSEMMKLKTVINHTPEAIVVTDANCRVQLKNPATDKLYARPIPYGEKFENNEHLQFFYPDGTLYKTSDLPLTRSALHGETQSNVEIVILIDGQKRNLLVNTAPIRDNMEKLIGAVGVFQDISKGKEIDELRHENERLVSANKARSEFLTIMSHELRTPLTSVIGYSILLKEKNPGRLNKKQELIMDKILLSSKHLLELINGILDLAKIESGKLEMQIEEISLLDIINETLKLFEERAENKNIILKKEIDPELPLMMVDRQKFKQILFNLIGNAIKFSKEEGGIITISAEKDANNAKISVSDTGIGIREEDTPRLFQRFEQLDSGITRKYDGAGLGLAITKQLVELHGGKIWVESKFGEGSKFIFLMPVSSLSHSVQY